MTSATNRLILAGALMALAAGICAAQSLQADIPFAFRAGDQVFPAGSYQVQLAGRFNEVVVLSGNRGTVTLFPTGATAPGRAAINTGDPTLTFECGPARCALIQLWTGSGAQALLFRQPLPRNESRPFLTHIPLK